MKINKQQTINLMVLLSVLISISQTNIIKNRARKEYNLLKKLLKGDSKK